MEFDSNVNVLKQYLRQYGWEVIREDSIFEHYRNFLDVELLFPTKKSDAGYPRAFKSTLKKIKRVCPEVSKLLCYAELIAQCENIKQKYSKNKSDWILLEPNCKYINSEIPDIYIPEILIFEK